MEAKLVRFNSHQDWFESDLPRDSILGPSPGGAAAELNVSRGVIYLWIKRGFLDHIRIGEDVVLISNDSIRRVKHILDELRLEYGQEGITGRPVARELEKRLPKLYLLEDAENL
jgi:hypothetical protein